MAESFSDAGESLLTPELVGDVLGCRKMKVRICSYPKRDKDKEETDAGTNQKQETSGEKRKTAPCSVPQNQQVAKQKFECHEQIFLTMDDYMDATVLACTRICWRLRVERREPNENEAAMLEKYENDMKLLL